MEAAGNSSSKKYSFLALGDSYTIGEGVAIEESWPHILQKELSFSDTTLDTPHIIAQTGWTTKDLIETLKKEQLPVGFDIVSLLIGVNNQYQGKSTEEFRLEFCSLLSTAIQYAENSKKNVFVLSIPDWGVSPFAKDRDCAKITREINEFNRIIQEETQKLELLFIDITQISRLAFNNPAYIASDGLHFSKRMHHLWVHEIIGQKFKNTLE